MQLPFSIGCVSIAVLLWARLTCPGFAGAAEPRLGNLPMVGPGKALSHLDDAILDHLVRSHATAATLAIADGDKLLYQRGYGWLDQEQTRKTAPTTPMRVASVSKPITAAAIYKLVANGQLSLETRVWPLLQSLMSADRADISTNDFSLTYAGFRSSPAVRVAARGSRKLGTVTKLDERWKHITIAELLKHEGGWDIKQLGFDPMFSRDRVIEELGLDHPPTPVDVILWMTGKPLQFDPGARSAYSNFGYCILGRVIEQVSRRSYLKYIRQEIFKPLGVKPKDVLLGHSDPDDRSPSEPWYNEKLYVDWMDAHGGVVISSIDLCQFLRGYWISGQPRKPGEKGFTYTFFGSMPGTSAIVHQRPDGINFACAFNGRHAGAPLDELNKSLNRLIDELDQ